VAAAAAPGHVCLRHAMAAGPRNADPIKQHLPPSPPPPAPLDSFAPPPSSLSDLPLGLVEDTRCGGTEEGEGGLSRLPCRRRGSVAAATVKFFLIAETCSGMALGLMMDGLDLRFRFF
jgi:hypothetical protein